MKRSVSGKTERKDQKISIQIYLVGGAVREIVRKNRDKIKDWDFAVEAPSFTEMREWIESNGFEIFVETPEYFTIRARAPKGYEFAGIDMTGKTFDFALCRSEGSYSDGRHPDEVKPGTLAEDLSRRDFTMNAMAMTSDGEIIDPFEGKIDITRKLVRCVREVDDRFNEDALRIMRALRFTVQLDFTPAVSIQHFLRVPKNIDLLDKISESRIRDELHKAFRVDTLETLFWLEQFPLIKQKVFAGPMWLEPTVKGR